MAQFPQSLGTAFAIAGFSPDPNLSPNNQGFVNAVLAVVSRAGLPFGFEAANLVLAGPASGAITLPTYRALVAADVPASILPGGFNGFGNPTNNVSGTATNGTSTLAMRQDAAPALDWTQSPTWTGAHTYSPANGQDGLSVLTAPGIDGRSTVSFTSNISSAKQYTAGIDPDGGTIKQWAIRDVTRGAIALSIKTGGSVVITSTLNINGNAPSSQITGWGTPTGAAVVANFNGTAATTLQIQNAIAKIITDLKAFGLYGA